MEEIRGELDEKWVEEGKFKKSRISHQRVYPVDRPAARLTGHTKNGEVQVPIKFPVNLQSSVLGRPDPVLSRPDTHVFVEITETGILSLCRISCEPGRHYSHDVDQERYEI